MLKFKSTYNYFFCRSKYRLHNYLNDVLKYNSGNFFKYHLKANKERAFLWINNPKVAGSKIHIDLVNILLDADFKNEQRGHYQIDWYDDVSDVSVGETVKLLFADDVFKFAFVRNPYDRLLSAWSYFCIDLESDDINYNHVREIMKQRGPDPSGRITFQSFVDLIYSHWEQTGCFDNEHWFEQNKRRIQF